MLTGTYIPQEQRKKAGNELLILIHHLHVAKLCGGARLREIIYVYEQISGARFVDIDFSTLVASRDTLTLTSNEFDLCYADAMIAKLREVGEHDGFAVEEARIVLLYMEDCSRTVVESAPQVSVNSKMLLLSLYNKFKSASAPPTKLPQDSLQAFSGYCMRFLTISEEQLSREANIALRVEELKTGLYNLKTKLLNTSVRQKDINALVPLLRHLRVLVPHDMQSGLVAQVDLDTEPYKSVCEILLEAKYVLAVSARCCKVEYAHSQVRGCNYRFIVPDAVFPLPLYTSEAMTANRSAAPLRKLQPARFVQSTREIIYQPDWDVPAGKSQRVVTAEESWIPKPAPVLQSLEYQFYTAWLELQRINDECATNSNGCTAKRAARMRRLVEIMADTEIVLTQHPYQNFLLARELTLALYYMRQKKRGGTKEFVAQCRGITTIALPAKLDNDQCVLYAQTRSSWRMSPDQHHKCLANEMMSKLSQLNTKDSLTSSDFYDSISCVRDLIEVKGMVDLDNLQQLLFPLIMKCQATSIAKSMFESHFHMLLHVSKELLGKMDEQEVLTAARAASKFVPPAPYIPPLPLLESVFLGQPNSKEFRLYSAFQELMLRNNKYQNDASTCTIEDIKAMLVSLQVAAATGLSVAGDQVQKAAWGGEILRFARYAMVAQHCDENLLDVIIPAYERIVGDRFPFDALRGAAVVGDVQRTITERECVVYFAQTVIEKLVVINAKAVMADEDYITVAIYMQELEQVAATLKDDAVLVSVRATFISLFSKSHGASVREADPLAEQFTFVSQACVALFGGTEQTLLGEFTLSQKVQELRTVLDNLKASVLSNPFSAKNVQKCLGDLRQSLSDVKTTTGQIGLIDVNVEPYSDLQNLLKEVPYILETADMFVDTAPVCGTLLEIPSPLLVPIVPIHSYTPEERAKFIKDRADGFRVDLALFEFDVNGRLRYAFDRKPDQYGNWTEQLVDQDASWVPNQQLIPYSAEFLCFQAWEKLQEIIARSVRDSSFTDDDQKDVIRLLEAINEFSVMTCNKIRESLFRDV